MVFHGYPWLSMTNHGYLWLSMVSHGYLWVIMVIHRYPWLTMTPSKFFILGMWWGRVGLGVKSSPLKTLGFIPNHPPIPYATHIFPTTIPMLRLPDHHHLHCHASSILFNPTTILTSSIMFTQQISVETLPRRGISDGEVRVLFFP